MIGKAPLNIEPDEALGNEFSHMKGIRVLVADLFPLVANTMTMILKLSGFAAFAAQNVDQAVEIARENVIHVAFIELLIGGTNALDAAEQILAIRPYCRIIIWTGRDEPVVSWVRREADKRIGGCTMLSKPIHPRDAMRIACGEPVPNRFAIPEKTQSSAAEDILSGSEFDAYLNNARETMLQLIRDQDLR